jgi:integrase
MYFNYGYYVITPDKKKKYTPLKWATGEKIKPVFWKDRPTYRAKQVKEFDYENFNIRLENISRAVKKVFRSEVNAGRLPTTDQLRDLLNRELNLIPEIANPYRESLNDYLKRFNNEIESGTRQTPGENKHKYKPGTTKNYKSFKNQLDLYQKERGKKIDFDDIGKEFYDDFINFFTDKQQSPGNIGKHIKCLKTIMRAALEERLHTNNEVNSKYFQRPTGKTYDIYLNKDEIIKLANHDLSFSPHYDLARDVFLVGVYTSQRYSDYCRIRKENIRTLQSGTRVIDLIQRKTGERVIIPIMPELETILKKYDYTLPKTYDQKVNKYIKEVAKLAGITEMIPIEKIQGGLEVKKDYAKHSLIKTHTARRSGATNMYLAGIPTIDIMKITGHKTESEFLKYIKVGKEETADNLSRHPYFKTTLKIAK